jgi:hypothetical protein
MQNADGTTDIYLGPQAPAGKEGNWLATVPGKGFSAILRLYGPTEAAIETRRLKMRLTKLCILVLMTFFVTACGSLNEYVVKKIESVGSKLTGVPVRVERVHLGLFRGLGEITRVTVANPEGYQTDYAFQMDLVRLNLRVLSLLTEPLVVRELVIDSPIVNFESHEAGVSNWGEIANNVRANQARADSQSAAAKPTPEKTLGKSLRIVVKRLVIQGVTFNLRRADGTTASGTLPAIELTEVGGSDGKTPGELGTVVFLAMARETFKQVSASSFQEGIDGMHPALEQLNAERIMAALEQKLTLSTEQWNRVKPVIEQQSQNLQKAINEARAQGFLELEFLPKRFGAATEHARVQLNEFLPREQVVKIESLLEELHQFTIEQIRNALVENLGRILRLSRDQIERLQPIFRDEIQKRSRLLSNLATAPDISFEDFMTKFEALQDETRQKVSEALDPDQVRALEKRQDQLRKLVQKAYFGIVVP